jgi:MoxR-like ATPase
MSLQIQEKQCCLIDAFHQGSIVIMDEINSSPMMESTLNALLMGKTPDGEPALKPGFLLIGTQNPISYSGRCAPSQALARRLLKMELMHYPEQEIKQILIKKGLHENDATQLTEAFHQQRLFAKRNHLQPAPNFRDVIRCAEQHLESIASAPKH